MQVNELMTQTFSKLFEYDERILNSYLTTNIVRIGADTDVPCQRMENLNPDNRVDNN